MEKIQLKSVDKGTYLEKSWKDAVRMPGTNWCGKGLIIASNDQRMSSTNCTTQAGELIVLKPWEDTQEQIDVADSMIQVTRT